MPASSPNADRDLSFLDQDLKIRCFFVGNQFLTEALANGHSVYDGPLPATDQPEYGELIDQLGDALDNNGDIDDETLIRAFGFEYREGESEEHFESDRERLEVEVARRVVDEAESFLNSVEVL